MPIDERQPTSNAEQRLMDMIRDLQLRVAALERKVAKQ